MNRDELKRVQMKRKDLSQNGQFDCTAEIRPAEGTVYGRLPTEHVMEVFVNEQLAMRVVCTPEHLDELVTGRLLTEGLIRSREDIRQLYVCEQGLICRVWLQEGVPWQRSDSMAVTVGTCCTDNRILAGRQAEELQPVIPIAWKASWLMDTAARLREGEPLFSVTHATHACYLAAGESLLCCREDIGRHNALDKAVGYGVLSETDLSGCWLFTTGRMPADMVTKAVRAGIPLLASKTWPTDRGVAIARQTGLTLVTVRGERDLTIWADGRKPDMY